MSPSSLQPGASLPARFFGYLRERFPLGAYGVLTALYVGGGFAVATRVGALPLQPWWRVGFLALGVLLVFFHLRIFDEFKDDDKDRIAHPERLVQRGVVSKRDLLFWGGGAVVAEAGIAAFLGPTSLAWWAAVFLFSLGMRVEFFLGSFLEPRPLTYAVTHQPIMFLLSGWIYAAAGLPLARFTDGPIVWHQLAGFGGLFAFEIARKLRAPAQETATELTYSKVHGPGRAAAVAIGLLLLATLATAALTSWWMLLVALGTIAHVRYALSPTPASAKLQNTLTSVALLALHLALAVSLRVTFFSGSDLH
jgi:4-hydroxybenzoate polyprenyltransferase